MRQKVRSYTREYLGKKPGRPENTPEVLWSKVFKRDLGPDDCWPWIGYRNEQGYGRVWIKDKGYYAHRVIYDLVNPGVISLKGPKSPYDPGWIRHTCDNPKCCNPKHMLVGTHAENMGDRKERGHYGYEHSTKSPRAKLTTEDVLDIRAKKKAGATCKALALLYEVSPSTIHGVLYGRHYQDV